MVFLQWQFVQSAQALTSVNTLSTGAVQKATFPGFSLLPG